MVAIVACGCGCTRGPAFAPCESGRIWPRHATPRHATPRHATRQPTARRLAFSPLRMLPAPQALSTEGHFAPIPHHPCDTDQ